MYNVSKSLQLILYTAFQDSLGTGITQFCGDSDDDDMGSGSGFNSTVCTSATVILISNTDCITAVSDPNNIDASTACSSTCRPLFQDVVDACGDTVCKISACAFIYVQLC